MTEINRILAAIDFSAHAEDALDYATGLAQRFHAELYILYVFEDSTAVFDSSLGAFDAAARPWLPEIHDLIESARQEHTKRLHPLTEKIGHLGVTVVPLFKDGRPAAEIVKTAADIHADLIVLGTHGRTGLSHVLLGSVAERVVRQAPCPVLTVKSKSGVENNTLKP